MAVKIIFADGSDLTIDATIRQTHERSNDVTTHPVEDGADVTDHIRPQPKRLSLQCVISQTDYAATAGASVSLITGRASLDGPAPEKNRHKLAFDKLEKTMAKRELVTVNTGLQVYKRMAIKSFVPVREASTGFDLVFPLELEEVVFAKTQTAQVGKKAIGKAAPGASPAQAKAQVSKTQDQASPAGAKGQKPAPAATPPQAAQAQSLLRRLFS